jgi:hypothetical protein
MLVSAIAVGLGFVAPIGGLANIAPAANEIRVTWEFPSPLIPDFNTLRLINLTRGELEINTLQFMKGAKIRAYKKTHILLGLGVYYIEKTTNAGRETSAGFCSYYGVTVPCRASNSISLYPEIAYSTVPRGICVALSFGIR